MKIRLKKIIGTALIVTTSFLMTTISLAVNLEAFEQNNLCGFRDEFGNEVISAKYDAVNEFRNGFGPVSKNSLWGFIDQYGNEVVPIIYAGVSYFDNYGLSPSIKGDKWGMVNTSGREEISFTYDELWYFDKDEITYAKKNGKWGKIDRWENEVVPFLYREMDIYTKFAPNKSKVFLDGKEIEFDAYNIYNNNYIKIRDIAAVLSGSEKQFEVIWDKEKQRINLLSGRPYTAVGGELEKNENATDNDKKTLRFTSSVIAKDDDELILQAYNIDFSNYFQLRDIAKFFNIGLKYDTKTKNININTTEDYTEE